MSSAMKVPIDKSAIPVLKNLKTAIKPVVKPKSEFELASERLDKADFQEYVAFRLNEDSKS
jgi:hypothetical protein